MNLVIGVVDACEIIPYVQHYYSIYKGESVFDGARGALGYIKVGLEEERTEVVTQREVTADGVNLPDMYSSNQLSSLQQLDNVESDILVQGMDGRQDTDLDGCSHGVREEENYEKSSVSADAAETVDIIPQFDARQYGMSSDATEFLADGTGLGEEQVEKTSMEEERAVVNIFTAESLLHGTVQAPGLELFDARLYEMGMYEFLGKAGEFEDLLVEDSGELRFVGQRLDISKPPGTLIQATFSHSDYTEEVVAAEYNTRQFEEVTSDVELGLCAPVTSWTINEVWVKQGCQHTGYQGYLGNTLLRDPGLQVEKKATIMAVNSLHGQELYNTRVRAGCTDTHKSIRVDTNFIMGEADFFLVEDHPEGEMYVANKYSGGENNSIIGVGSGLEVKPRALDNPGYKAETAAQALFSINEEVNKRLQQEEEAISMAKVKEEFVKDFSYDRLYDYHHDELGPCTSVVGNLPQLNSCSVSVVINPAGKVVKCMDNNKISVVEEECSEISAASARNITCKVEMKDSSVRGAMQDPNTLVGVYEIPEVMGDGAKDTQLYLGDTMEDLHDKKAMEDAPENVEDEEAIVSSPEGVTFLLGVFSALGCIVEWASRFSLTMVDDPKEYASSTYKGQAEEENVIDKREIVEDHDIPDYYGSDNNLLGLRSKGDLWGDVVLIIADMGPMAQEYNKQQARQPNTIPHKEEEMNYEFPDPTGENNDLLGLGKVNNVGVDETFLPADAGPSAELKEKEQLDTAICTVEVQSILEISHIQTANEIWIEPNSSYGETDVYVNITETGEPYDDTVSATEPGWDLFPYNELTWAEVEYDAASAEYIAAREILQAACNKAVTELMHGDFEEERKKMMIQQLDLYVEHLICAFCDKDACHIGLVGHHLPDHVESNLLALNEMTEEVKDAIRGYSSTSSPTRVIQRQVMIRDDSSFHKWPDIKGKSLKFPRFPSKLPIPSPEASPGTSSTSFSPSSPRTCPSCASMPPTSPPGTSRCAAVPGVLSSSSRPGWRTSSPSAGRESVPPPSSSPWSSSRG